MGVDQSRQDDMTGEVHDRIGGAGQRRAGADLPDDAIDRVEPAVGKLAALVVHRDDECVLHQKRRHSVISPLRVVGVRDGIVWSASMHRPFCCQSKGRVLV